jgi:hypothetical protein
MAEPLHDIRTKVPTQTLSVIQALEMATGETMAEIARVWLTERAEIEIHKATIIARVLRGEVGNGAGEGKDS